MHRLATGAFVKKANLLRLIKLYKIYYCPNLVAQFVGNVLDGLIKFVSRIVKVLFYQ